MLQFVADPHSYTWNGAPVPSVTQVLDQLGHLRAVPRGVLATARHRGSEVHLACAMDDRGDLDEDAYMATERGQFIMGYVRGWRKFCDTMGARWRHIEEPIFHSRLGYAGTPDRIGWVQDVDTLVDIKTGPHHPICGLQTEAYNRAHRDYREVNECKQRMTVHLSALGEYSLHWWMDSATDWAVFTSLLNVYNWRPR